MIGVPEREEETVHERSPRDGGAIPSRRETHDEVVLRESHGFSLTERVAAETPALDTLSLLEDRRHSEAHLIHPRGADPFITRDEHGYLYLHTSQHSISIWRSTDLHGIASGRPQFQWRPSRVQTRATRNLWAPELHRIGSRWYIYYAADDGRNENHRMYVLESQGHDALGPYRFLGRVRPHSEDRWAIDGTVLQWEGRCYFIWSGWPGKKNGLQNLYIAPMDTPWSLAAPRALLSTPTFDWELWVNEGPQVLERDGRLFVVYSAHGSWTDDYKLGLLEFCGGRIDDPSCWVKHRDPVFATVPQEHSLSRTGIYAPGHASFLTLNDRGEDWIFYHVAKHKGAGWKREVRAQRFEWRTDGYPYFRAPHPVKRRERSKLVKA